MKSGEDVGRKRALDELSAADRHLEVLADHGARGGRPHGDDDLRLDGLDLALEPLVAGVDLALRRGLVQAALSTQLPLEVLHRVGDIELLPVDPGRLERPVEEAAGGPDEGQALLVLLVARLLADQHDSCVGVAGAEHRLGGIGPERAVLAPPRILADRFKALRHRTLESAG